MNLFRILRILGHEKAAGNEHRLYDEKIHESILGRGILRNAK